MTDPAIRCTALSKRYRLYPRSFDRLREVLTLGRRSYGKDFWAVRDVTLEIPRGSVFGLLGRNGAGKSTTLKMFAGRLRPTSGVLEVRGAVSCILELGMGLNPNLTGRQNARILALFLGLDPWSVEGQIDRIIDFAEIGQFADEPLAHYSSGMKARLSIAALTALRPEILILDEALATGDTAFAAKCKRFVRELCTSGCTTIVVSHDLGFLQEACDQLAWLDAGQVRVVGEPRAVVGQYLAALGAPPATQPAPRTLTLRLDPVEGAAVTLLLHSAQWQDAEGKSLWGGHLASDTWSGLQERSADAGISIEARTRGWGEPTLELGEHAPCRPLHVSPGAPGLLTLPLPTASASQLFLAGQTTAPIRVRAVVDTELIELGRIEPEAWFERRFPLPASSAQASKTS